MRTAIVAAALLALPGVASAANVTRTATGWTDVAPSVDSVIVYVSASGSDANSGLSTVLPKLTLSAAATVAFAVDVKPSHIRLKCGDTWTNQTLGGYHNLNGRGSDEPIVFESWDFTNGGTSCATRPQIRTNGSALGSMLSRGGSGTTTHVYVLGIDFYDAAKDPALGGSTTAPNTTGIQLFDGGDDIVIENCAFRFLFNGLTIQYISGPSPQNITIRRNLFVDMYNGGNNSGHAQGFYMEGLVGTNVVEENYFEHNGWNVAGGQNADVFNHHIYIDDSKNIAVRNNVFGTDSSLSVKFVVYGNETATIPQMTGMTISNNTFYEGEVGLSMAADGGAACYATTGCITGTSITNNVFTQVDKSNPTGRGLGWGMELKETQSSTISNNLCSQFSTGGASGTYCIMLHDDTSSGISGNDTISSNLAYRIGTAGINIGPQAAWLGGVAVTGNTIQDPDLNAVMIQHDSASFTGVAYTNQIYSPTNVSHLAIINGVTKTYAQWLTASSETGSANTTVSYPFPTRTMDTYAAANGMTDYSGYATAIRAASRANWPSNLTAFCINDYMRAGFSMAAVGGCTTTQTDQASGRNRPIVYGGWFALLLLVCSGAALAGHLSHRRKAIAADEAHVHEIDEATYLALAELQHEGLDGITVGLTALCKDCREPLFLPRQPKRKLN